MHRVLGRTGLTVAALGLGTVELGMEYGIKAPGEFGRPSDDDAVALLRSAADGGVDFFDTAPGYGSAERLLGDALGDRPACLLATKVTVPRDAHGACPAGAELRRAIDESVRASLAALGRERLDLVQIHNATLDVLESGELAAALEEHRAAGRIRFLGASVYTETEALAAVSVGCFETLQVAYNMLDQRMAARVFPAARAAGAGIIARSAFLKGALTPKAQWLPADLGPLASAADALRKGLGVEWDELPHVALRFCLTSRDVATVIVGVRTAEELAEALGSAATGPLSPDEMAIISAHSITDDALLNPAKWSGV